MDCRIGRSLGTSLYHISHDLCTSLIVRQYWPSHVTLGQHTTTRQCPTCAARLDRSLHISQSVSFVDWLHELWLVHVSKITSTNKRQHRPSQVQIRRVTSVKDINHLQKSLRMIRGMCASNGMHQCQITIGSICVGIWISWKRCYQRQASSSRWH